MINLILLLTMLVPASHGTEVSRRSFLCGFAGASAAAVVAQSPLSKLIPSSDTRMASRIAEITSSGRYDIAAMYANPDQLYWILSEETIKKSVGQMATEMAEVESELARVFQVPLEHIYEEARFLVDPNKYCTDKYAVIRQFPALGPRFETLYLEKLAQRQSIAAVFVNKQVQGIEENWRRWVEFQARFSAQRMAAVEEETAEAAVEEETGVATGQTGVPRLAISAQATQAECEDELAPLASTEVPPANDVSSEPPAL